MNISKMSDMIVIKDLKKLERIVRGFLELFEKRTFKEVISSSNYFFFHFLRLNLSVVGLFIDFLTSGLDFGSF